jgi:hypothetical protein
MMLIALDYDGTYTRDPELWDAFIAHAKERGHEIKIATMRYPTEPIPDIGLEVIYTSRKAKYGCMDAHIWIDDQPNFLFSGG